MTRVALFGGSFNPPHVAHQLVALYVLETQPIDELWFVPVYSHPFQKKLADYDHRVAMCEAAIASLGPRVRVSRAEQQLAIRQGDKFTGRTLELVESITDHDPAIEPRLVIGADILLEAHKWYRWDELIRRAPVIALGRTGFTPPPGVTLTGVTMPEISSTHVRDLLAAGNLDAPELVALLPRDVLRYIATHRLYQRSPT